MTKDQTIKSKLNISTVLILIVGGVVFIIGAYFITTNSLQEEYPQIIGIVVGLLFGLFGLISIFSIFLIDKYVLDQEKLVVKSIFNYPKKVIYLQDIVSYNEIEKENNYKKWKDLTIFTNQHKVKISSSVVSNYSLFKERLSNNKSRNEYSEKLWAYRVKNRFGWSFFVAGLLFTLFFLKIYKTPYKEILPDQLITLAGTVSESLKINNYGRKRSKSIHIKFDEYPDFIFLISGYSFSFSDANGITANISSGDDIQIDILSEAYSKKLIKTEELTFWDRTINYRYIGIYGLRKDNRAFLTLKSINKRHKSDSSSLGIWFLLIIGLAGITLGIYYITMKKPAANSKPYPIAG